MQKQIYDNCKDFWNPNIGEKLKSYLGQNILINLRNASITGKLDKVDNSRDFDPSLSIFTEQGERVIQLIKFDPQKFKLLDKDEVRSIELVS